VAENAPASWGRATLTIVTVSAYSIVDTDTVTRTMARVNDDPVGTGSTGSDSTGVTPSGPGGDFIPFGVWRAL